MNFRFASISFVLLLLLLSISTKAASAQTCTNDPSGGIVANCNRGSCQGTYQFSLPNGTDIAVSFVGLECCGKIVLVAVDGGACGTDSLRSMESKHVLEELSANGTQLMVRNCKGHFLAYQPRTPLVPSYFDGMHINLGLPGE